MKSMARAILFGGIIVATGGAVADMVSSAMGETDKDQAASSMPAEPQAGEPTASTEAAVPGSTEGAAQDVAAGGTSAEPQANDSMTTAAVTTPTAPPVTVASPLPPRRPYVVASIPSAFPSSVDDAGHGLVARITHADRYGNSAVMTAAWAFPVSSDDAGRYLVASRTHADIFLDRPVRVAQTEQRRADSSGN